MSEKPPPSRTGLIDGAGRALAVRPGVDDGVDRWGGPMECLNNSPGSSILEEPPGGQMTRRFLVSFGALAILFAAPCAAKTAAKAKSSSIPRTPDGHPDLQGFWTNATITPVERPAAWAAKPTISDGEAKDYEAKQLKELNDQDGQSDGPLIAAALSSGTGGYNVLFIDRGQELARVDGVKRTSLIIDPPDGKMPPMLPEARQRMSGLFRNFNR